MGMMGILSCPVMADVPGDLNSPISITQEQAPKYLTDQASTQMVTPPPSVATILDELADDDTMRQVDGVDFSGSSVFSEQQLQAVAAPFIGQLLDSADIEELRYRLTRLYVDQGYINSGAIVAGYDFKTKRLQIRLKEGSIKDIQVQTDGLLSPEYVAGRLRLYGKAPFHLPTMQERFLLLLDDPAIAGIYGGVAPGMEPGEAVLQAQATSTDPFSISLSFDNRGPVSVGEKQGTINATLQNLSGWGEEITFGFSSNTEKKRYGIIALNIPINFYDTRLHASYQRSTMAVVQEPMDILGIEGDYEAYEFGLTHPIIHSLKRSVILGINIGHKTNDTWLRLNQPDSRFCFSQGCKDGHSAISTIGFTQRWTERSSKYVYSMHSFITLGIDAFGTIQDDVNNIDSHFVTWVLQQSYAHQWLNRRLQFIGRLDTQLADSPLPALQKAAIGGATSVRGYRENALIRDQIILGSVELRYGLLSPTQQSSWGNLQGAVFSDFAQAWNKNTNKAIPDESLHSVGVGLLWSWKNDIQAQVYWGHQLKSLHTDNSGSWQEDGIHVRIQVTY
ncbi:hypothetical protein TI03_00935 [Achromatium sp. WMS1]|nr:hypothetical protein TI03_00935 [Achromatium sp. WMS1]